MLAMREDVLPADTTESHTFVATNIKIYFDMITLMKEPYNLGISKKTDLLC